jgi:hypothetical protein
MYLLLSAYRGPNGRIILYLMALEDIVWDGADWTHLA